ncbi:MAG: hypothetical protein ACRDPK_18385 [Carbonactinosporaceae bacterium]
MATAKVIQLRPVLPGRPRPRRPVLGSDGSVLLEWDEGRGLHVAVCDRCTETASSERLDQAHEWAEEHRCDPELADLLARVLDQKAA